MQEQVHVVSYPSSVMKENFLSVFLSMPAETNGKQEPTVKNVVYSDFPAHEHHHKGKGREDNTTCSEEAPAGQR